MQRAVDKASEELSNSGAVDELWCDWESITDAVESRQWLQQNIVITRGIVHAAAAGFADAFKQVGHTWLARHVGWSAQGSWVMGCVLSLCAFCCCCCC